MIPVKNLSTHTCINMHRYINIYMCVCACVCVCVFVRVCVCVCAVKRKEKAIYSLLLLPAQNLGAPRWKTERQKAKTKKKVHFLFCQKRIHFLF